MARAILCILSRVLLFILIPFAGGGGKPGLVRINEALVTIITRKRNILIVS